ncbi:MAG: hypothetical protein IJF71_02330, partial [Clostridia bacterium]|nr:hypothetical protein [Clostridia bacterium]
MSKALEKKTILTIAIIGGIFLMAAIIIGIVIAATPDTPPAPLDALEKPKNLRITDGVLTWDTVPNATQYSITIDGKEYTVSDTQYTLPTYSASRDITVFVVALGDEKKYTESPASTTVYSFKKEDSGVTPPPDTPTPDLPPAAETATPGLKYTPINDGAEYEVSIGSVASNVKSIYIPDA